jgi:hypothetical protein
MINENLIQELEDILEGEIKNINIPFQKGNSIRIKNYAIRKKSDVYLIFDCKNNKKITETYFKTSAVAIAKNLAEGKDITYRALNLDKLLLKHYNDAVFYKNIIAKSTNKNIVYARKARLEQAIIKSQVVKENLNKFIY